MSLYSSTSLSTFIYYVVGVHVDVTYVAKNFYSLLEWIMKRMNFPFYAMTFLHGLAEITKTKDFGDNSGIL